MVQSSEAVQISQRYQAGERNFQDIQLRRLDLRGINLSNANLRGADLSYSNLRDVNFSGADLRDAYLNEADLTGANLQGANLQNASLIKSYLIKANFQRANLQESYLTSAYATKANFEQANLQGAYLNGTQFTGATLSRSKYNDKTRFDSCFNPLENGMEQVTALINFVEPVKMINQPTQISKNDEVTIAQLLDIFHHINHQSHRYLGEKMTLKYWESSQPNAEWLEQFQVNKLGKIEFSGDLETTISPKELQDVRQWLKSYIKSCSQIFPNFAKMIDRQRLSVIFPAAISSPKSESYSTNFSLPITQNSLNLVAV
ncbi:pentapeptide repeat protein [Rippkaea orientalis PCC 8801]|uniref:Pentapeptide repeat protein n=1 Tax=Rippkaea orientalis (strain PCC 8801 / RF-1) TaxID=41431 RepID=B7JVR5_RIPO1|nr:pentapeptide repeat-containing protein [Rippkaea orientalis]ACK64636.1 pentapeptide repeat protein [Rippkaea orientalis PCC 8801]